MTVRPAVETDSEQIREVATRSFRNSYSLSPEEIETIVEEAFGDDAVADCLEDDDRRLLVDERDDNVVGFVETKLTDTSTGELVWLHVEPEARGQGVGTDLFEQAAAQLRERAAEHVHGLVMAQNEEGNQFFERWGFERGESMERKIAGQPYQIQVFTGTPEEFGDGIESDDSDEESVPADGEIVVDDETRYIDTDEELPGDDGRFYVVFTDQAYDDQYGFYCSNCGTFVDAVDGQGKIVCGECGNVHQPEEWDKSYL